MKELENPKLLQEALPDLYNEIQMLFERDGYAELLAQMPALLLIGRSKCNADDCATIYTGSIPEDARGTARQDAVDLDAESGLMVVDLFENKIVGFEILNRTDIRNMVRKVLP